MRLLYVIDSLAPGGAETSLVEMTPGLVASGIELHVLPLGTASDLAEPIRAAGAVLHQRLSPPGRIGGLRAVMQTARRARPALIHTTLFEADAAGRTAARLLGVRSSTSLVNEYYGTSHAGEVAPAKLRAVQVVDAVTAHFASRFHAVSQAVADSVGPKLRIRPGRIEVIPRGRDPRRFPFRDASLRADTRADLGLGTGVPVVLAVGRLEPQKGFGDLLDALPAIAAVHPKAIVLVAGRDGRAAHDLRARASASPIEVRFLGHRTDMPALLAAADVLAFPSHREGSPGTLIEAMAVGTPIVASDIAPCREVLGGGAPTALVTPVGDPRLLGAAISAVLADAAGSGERAAAGRERFDRLYTIESVAARMADFFARAAEPGRPGGHAKGGDRER